jgi:hypothetical protein
MLVLRWLLRLVVAVLALVALLFLGARFHDGPLGPIPGGPLEQGERAAAPVTDWSFAKDVGEVELQLASQDRSRTTWILVFDGKAYVPASLGSPPGKTWHLEAAKDGRAVLRIEGTRYPVTLTKLDDAVVQVMAEKLRAEVARKYPNPPSGGAGVWLFEVASR